MYEYARINGYYLVKTDNDKINIIYINIMKLCMTIIVKFGC